MVLKEFGNVPHLLRCRKAIKIQIIWSTTTLCWFSTRYFNIKLPFFASLKYAPILTITINCHLRNLIGIRTLFESGFYWRLCGNCIVFCLTDWVLLKVSKVSFLRALREGAPEMELFLENQGQRKKKLS